MGSIHCNILAIGINGFEASTYRTYVSKSFRNKQGFVQSISVKYRLGLERYR